MNAWTPKSGPCRIPTFEDVREASERIARDVYRTPVFTCDSIDRCVGARLFFKCESFQKTGSFKIRGATNAVRCLPESQAKRGVATHSSGNHGAALALAAARRGIRAHIVMPTHAPIVKQRAVERYGATIVRCEPTLQAREATLNQLIERTGAVFVHPYDDALVVAGQGTAALELLQQIPDLDIVMAPIGGGGLMAGTILAVAACSSAAVIAAEPLGASDAFQSLAEGRIVPSLQPQTMADGLRTSLGNLNFEIIRQGIGSIVTVDEPWIARAVRMLFERAKLVVEPSAAVPLAALLANKVDVREKRVGIIVSGGNLDPSRLTQIFAMDGDQGASRPN